MLKLANSTTETTYEYDDRGRMAKKTVSEFWNDNVPTVTTVYPDNKDMDVETGVELEEAIGISALETFLTAAAGAIIGNLLYRAIRKN